MRNLSGNKKASVFYHNLFDYPLSEEEVNRWEVGELVLPLFPKKIRVDEEDGFYFISGREYTISLRRQRSVCSRRKIELAKRAAFILSSLPTIKMVALTGSLAMLNADQGSDIDLMFITKPGFLWTTRLLVYLLLSVCGIPFRRFGKDKTRDKLCLNIWLDESDLVWDKRDIFTAHEIAQIVPMVNKGKAYEKFLFSNLWILDFWPNAIDRKKLDLRFSENKKVSGVACCFWFPLEFFLFFAQKLYMVGKHKKGVVSLKRAVFHPVDLSRIVLRRIKTS